MFAVFFAGFFPGDFEEKPGLMALTVMPRGAPATYRAEARTIVDLRELQGPRRVGHRGRLLPGAPIQSPP